MATSERWEKKTKLELYVKSNIWFPRYMMIQYYDDTQQVATATKRVISLTNAHFTQKLKFTKNWKK